MVAFPLLKTKKTKALLTFMLVLFLNFTNAQTTFFNANFENGTGVNAWTPTSTGVNDSNWLRGTDNAQHNRAPFLLDPGTGNITSCMYTQRHGGGSQYKNSTNILATSPIIDFSGYENITLSIDTRTDISDNTNDGMKVQYQLNSGGWKNLGNGSGWYTENISSLGSNGWSGGDNNSLWQTRNINISTQDINFNGNNNVQFRVVFASNGNARGIGGAFDNFKLIGFATPEISVSGNGTNIIDGNTTPTLADFTDFGVTSIGTPITRTFTIQNNGLSPLTIGTFSITGADAAEFTLITPPAASIASGGSTTFTVSFSPGALGVGNATISFVNNDTNENPFDFAISGTGGEPEINITGFGNNIFDDASSATGTNGTLFPDAILGGNSTSTFTIQNTGTTPLNLTGTPFVQLSGSGTFTVTGFPTSPIPAGGSVTFTITFSPSTVGSYLAIVTINNNDTDESIYDFAIQGNCIISGREIDIQGNDTSISDADTTPSIIDLTDFGTTYVGLPISIPFQVYSLGSNTLSVTSVAITGGTGFTTTNLNENINSGSVASFVATFTPTATGTFSATITVNNDSNVTAGKNVYTFTVRAQVAVMPTISNAPGGVTTNLRLWLKADKNIGSYTDGASLTTWQDNVFGNTRNANTKTSKSPVFYNNATNNVNFNPVINFNGGSAMYGGQGFNNHDMFIVVKPKVAINRSTSAQDIFCGDDVNTNQGSQDVTGFSMGNSSARYLNEIVAYNQAANTEYGEAEINGTKSYVGPQIFNPRKRDNTANSLMHIYNNGTQLTASNVATGTYKNILNSRYWLGRSEFFDSSYGGDILEVITYDARNTDGNRRKIESYLAIKYGITLGNNGTSLDYVDSNGTTIYNASAGFNFDVAGIGRDDVAQLNQKQSKTVNKEEDITLGLNTIFATNNQNSNSFGSDKRFLMWGNNNASLAAAAPLIVNISSGITPALTTNVDFTSVQRTWRVIETGGDVGTVKVSLPSTMLTATLSPPGDFYMFISDTPVFTPTAEYRVMTANGSNLETSFDFNGTKYITFGFAPERTFVRAIDFNGTSDYVNSGNNVNLNGSFSASAWIKRDATNGTILSKKNATTGYEFFINASGNAQMTWTNGAATQSITSTIGIPTSRWHNLAVTYDGITARMYIDGVLNNSANVLAPQNNAFEFLVAASNSASITKHFNGSIDEVRIWNTTLSVNQLRFLMNQEMDKHTDGSTKGAIIPQNVTLNEVVSLPWSNLMLYYPMSTYTYTNVKDKSNNNITGALKNVTTIDRQTAPLPYDSRTTGNWTTATTWTNNTSNYIPNSNSVIDGSTPIDWNIVRINNDVISTGNKTMLGLLVNTTRNLFVQNDTKMQISHYLLLNGKIDLVGRSQLIQTLNCDLDVVSTGTLERDQQGTGNLYNYNYWSSPVSTEASVVSNNTGYTLNNAMKNGTTATTPANINWVGGFNGSTSPFSIARRWLHKFTNLSPAYANWQQITENSILETGQGYSMKGSGVVAPPAISTQNYVFVGKPNNGLISSTGLNIGAGAINLIGNPYASALDATAFINDNLSRIDGTLYFWEHYATNNTHYLAAYQGGYATRTALGGVSPVAPALISGAGSSTRIPGRFIPVGQAFFVKGNATGGTITFNNNQRLFVKEENGDSNIMFRNATSSNSQNSTQETNQEDNFEISPYKLIRLSFTAIEGNMQRQLLLGFTPNNEATSGLDNGYDGAAIDLQTNDAYFPLLNKNLVIQAEGTFNDNGIFPINIKSSSNGNGKFVIDELVNFDQNQEIYLHDNQTEIYHSLKNGEIILPISTGEITNRFTIRFKNNTLDNDSFDLNTNTFYHFNNELVILQQLLDEDINEIRVYNVLGQNIKTWTSNDFDSSSSRVTLPTKSFAKGVYIVNVTTKKGKYSKKIIVE
jgi:hypothetical protein